MPQILISTTGSLGDLNPMLAVGEELLALGAKVTFATYPCYEDACRKSGFGFVALGGPESYVSSLRYSREMLADGSFEMFVDRVNFDHLEPQYAQLLAAADGADLLLASAHVVAAHLVAEKVGIPYVACATCLIHLRSVATIGSDRYRKLATASARWQSVLRKFRLDHQLARKVLPMASLLSDAAKVVGVLPSFLVSAQDTRNPKLEVVGYANHRQSEWMVPDDELRAFCDERTVAFSFGSFADACDPNYFFEESVAACRMLNLKWVFVSQHVKPDMLEGSSDDGLVRNTLAPGAVFPLVGMTVHHGGTGTLIAACKSLKPMVVVPFFLDQPLHAERMHSLIGCPVISATEYSRHTAVQALRQALENREAMSASLRELMAGETDGAVRGAQQTLAVLKAPKKDLFRAPSTATPRA